MTLRQWSSEICTAEFKELQANTLCLSRDGQHGLLAGRRSLALIDMEQPKELVKKVTRSSRWDVVASQWNPTSQYSNHVALCCNDRIEIYVWDNKDFSADEPIRGHTRQVSDLHWNYKEPSLLASSSLDGNIHVWDIRDLKKPCQSFQTIIGASHVRWSRGDSHYLASAHEGDVKMWDSRNDSAPLTYLSAHISRVHSVDWSYGDGHSLVTASNDCTVKFHCVTGKIVETSPSCLSTSVPVWRARFSPWGEGMVTVLVPHLGAHEHSLFLWNVKNLTSPVHTFVGHRDVILDFEWRKSGPGNLDWQLVTWSKDQSLRMWALDHETQYRCGVDDMDTESDSESESLSDVFDQATEALEASYMEDVVEEKMVKKVEFSGILAKRVRESSLDSPVKEHSPESTMENTLQQEFALLDTNFNFIMVTDKDLEKRLCKVVGTTAHSRLLLLIMFPPTYPVSTSPTFTFLKGSSMNPQNKAKILKNLQDNASLQVRRNRGCLERCLRQLESQLEQINQEAVVEDQVTRNSFPFIRTPDYLSFSTFLDSSIPHPRTSGASFCSSGLLVCFGRPAYQIQVEQGTTETGVTPRAYSGYLSNLSSKTDSDLLKSSLRPGSGRYGTLQSTPTFTEKPRFTVGPEFSPTQVGEVDQAVVTSSTIRRGRFKVKRVTSGAQEDFVTVKSRRTSRTKQKELGVSLKVTIYNISNMMPVSKELAKGYSVLEDPVAMCRHNYDVAADSGRPDLAQTWDLAAQVALAARQVEQEMEGQGELWASCPMGKSLLCSLLQHHLDYRDFQTVSLLVTAFTEQTSPDKRSSVDKGVEPIAGNRDKFWFLKAGALTDGLGDSPYHTVHGPTYATVHGMSGRTCSAGSDIANLACSLENTFVKKNNRSNSWADASQEEPFLSNKNVQSSTKVKEKPQHGKFRYGLLDSTKSSTYSAMMAAYSDVLYNWGFLEQRCAIQKHGAVVPTEIHRSKVTTGCPLCEGRVDSKSCSKCCKPGLFCAVCRLPVKGLGAVCPMCGHGGHLNHVRDWFKDHNLCPATCGCKCLKFF